MSETPMRDQLKGIRNKIVGSEESDSATVTEPNVWNNKHTGPTKRKPRRNNQPKKASKMVMLNTNATPIGFNINDLDKYVNIQDTSLRKLSSKKFTLLFGDVISIQRAIDYATHPKLLPEHLMSSRLGKGVMKKLGKQLTTIPNFWAYVGYVLVERLQQDDELLNVMLNNDGIINVEINETKTFRGLTKIATPVPNEGMYTGVVREVVNAFRETVDLDDAATTARLEGLLYDLKADKELSVFAGIDVSTDFL